MNVYERLSSTEQADYDKLTTREGKRLFLQAYFKRDLAAFIFLWGYRDLGAFHQKEIAELAKFRYLTDYPVRRLYLWSRGFFKTSVIQEGHNGWLIVNNPNIRILTPSFSLDVAKKPLAAIRNQFIFNNEFRYFFKEFCPKPNKDGKIEFGTTENLTIPNRTKNYKEPTIMAAGIGTNVTGLHFDVIAPDDLVNRDSVSNDTQVQASKNYFSLLGPLFDNPTVPRFKMTGTIYHFNDLHSDLRKNPKWDTSVIPVHDENYNFKFPERISKAAFEEEILKDPQMNPYDIQSQYLLNPIDPAQRKFEETWVQYYDVLPEGLTEYLYGDPASTKKATSDYTVIERWGFDANMNMYLIDAYRDRLESMERINLYVGVAKQCRNLKGAKYEVIGGRHGDLENIRQEFLKARLPIAPSETKATVASKRDRIEQRLVGQFHAGKIFLPRSLPKVYSYDGKGYDFVQEYLLELRQFPFSEHDDILDCHSQAFDGSFITKGSKALKVNTKEDAFEWWRQKAIESKRGSRARFSFGARSKRVSIPFTKSFR